MAKQCNIPPLRKVIVNADDFGGSRDTNRAILQAFLKGLISRTTIMANMPAFEDACCLAHKNNLQGQVGLHLNLTEGPALTSSILDCNWFCHSGAFRPRRRRLLPLSRKERIALEYEIVAQFEACQRQRITPKHLDSHHHIHGDFGIAPVVICVAKRLGIQSVRINRNCGGLLAGRRTPNAIASRGLSFSANLRLRLHGLAETCYFGDGYDTARVLSTTRNDVEVMVHPRFAHSGRLIDLSGEDLEVMIKTLGILPTPWFR